MAGMIPQVQQGDLDPQAIAADLLVLGNAR